MILYLTHITTNHLLSPHQFGFLPGRSCTTQLLDVLNYLTVNLDAGHCIDVIYLDFQKAFDSVPHKRLLRKLSTFGIHGKLLKWIENFLLHRKQKVVLNGFHSKPSAVVSGVPQGSILGSLLFIMFINDLLLAVDSPVYIFADDTKIIRVIKSRTDFLMLQNDLDSLFNWSKLWQLNFNISKCKLMRFGYSYQYGTYTVGDTKIDSVEFHKDLGILFDNSLKFHQHTT